MPKPPKWNHPDSTREGRIERATWVFKEADGKLDMGGVTEYLTKKGCTGEEILIALDQATSGELVKSALN